MKRRNAMIDWALGRFLMNTFGFQGAEAKSIQELFQTGAWMNEMTLHGVNWTSKPNMKPLTNFVELDFQLRCQINDKEIILKKNKK